MADLKPNYEVSKASVTRDTRGIATRFHTWFFTPPNFQATLIFLAPLQALTTQLWPAWLAIDLLIMIGLTDLRFRLPLRMPRDIGGLDQSDVIQVQREVPKLWGLYKRVETQLIAQAAQGIVYLGYVMSADRSKHGLELWATGSDVRTHMMLAGTTGSGKTKTLQGLIFNVLLWGSGAIFVDGKAASDLAYEMWCLARRRGREDDILFLSFLTGGTDPFDRLQKKGKAGPHIERGFQSNSIQPFADGEASFLLQLLASLIPKASGDGATWQTKALNMIDALIRVLCYKRSIGELETSVVAIRHYLALDNLVQFYIEGRDGKLPELAYLPIKAYFETALPGFQPSLADQPDQWTSEVRAQHGYLTGQFGRILSMMMDTYGYVFGDRFGEIDTMDVTLNNRILIALIPSMEKSQEEAGALGKLLLACIRLSMAQNLGHQLEGTKQDVVDIKATNTPFPMPVVTDELGYYFAPGMAVMYAQARQLNYWMIAAFQDLQALKRGEGQDEVGSLIANTKFKYCLALEDPEETFELFRKAGGESAFNVISGHDGSSSILGSGWSSQNSTRVDVRDRIDLLELKNLDAGQGVMIFKDAVVRTSAFYVPPAEMTSKIPARINRFVQVPMPDLERLPPALAKHEFKKNAEAQAQAEIRNALARGKPYYETLNDPILDALISAGKHMNQLTAERFTAHERAIVLFEVAKAKLMELQNSGHSSPYHKAVEAPTVIFDDDVLDELDENAIEDY